MRVSRLVAGGAWLCREKTHISAAIENLMHSTYYAQTSKFIHHIITHSGVTTLHAHTRRCTVPSHRLSHCFPLLFRTLNTATRSYLHQLNVSLKTWHHYILTYTYTSMWFAHVRIVTRNSTGRGIASSLRFPVDTYISSSTLSENASCLGKSANERTKSTLVHKKKVINFGSQL